MIENFISAFQRYITKMITSEDNKDINTFHKGTWILIHPVYNTIMLSSNRSVSPITFSERFNQVGCIESNKQTNWSNRSRVNWSDGKFYSCVIIP